MAYQFTDTNFQEEVIDSGKTTLIDFWAEWCGPCKMMNPVIEELATELDGKVVVGKLNVDDNQKIPMKYGIRSIPTLLIFKNGELKDKVVGYQNKDALQKRLDAVMS